MTEQQRYDVVRTEPGFELRHYPEHRVAEVRTEGTFSSAGSTAFRPLVGYIGGQNDTSTGMAMTAPVIQRRDEPADLPSTTTVVEPGRYIVSFVLPAADPEEPTPAPVDPRVNVRVVAPEYAAVAQFSGRWSASAYERHVEALHAAITASGLEETGPPRFARFDPPWTPWFMRRNEVVIPVRVP